MQLLAEKSGGSGGASGIGRAAARRFAEEGATVILADRTQRALKEAVDELNADGNRHRGIVLDVANEQDWIRAIKEVGAVYGRLDVLANNASAGKFYKLEDNSLEHWHWTIAVNLDGPFLGIKHSLPLLVRAGKGSIINTSSVMGVMGMAYCALYAVAKAGVRQLTKIVALECTEAGNGVRVNTVIPGLFNTPAVAESLADTTQARPPLKDTPLARMDDPVELAEAMVSLASDESSFMTGSEVTVDGGITAT